MSSISDLVLRRTQAVTGIIFGLFLAIHLANTGLAAISGELYDAAQRVLRIAYQAWFVEATVLGALVMHLAAGLLRKRAGRPPPVTWRGRWHRNAGLFLALFVFGHVAAVRGASWFADVYPGFSGLSFTLAHVPGFFYPYYLVLGTAGLFHGLNGIFLAVARLGWRARLGSRAILVATAAGGGLLLIALLGIGGLLYEVGDPYDNDYARLVLRLVGDEAP